jgi:hypothetical protein
MNQEEFYKHKERMALRQDLVRAAEGTALQSFRYYRDLYSKKSDAINNEALLEHQVTN